MEDNSKLIEALFEKTTDYAKVSYEVFKLKTLDKASDIVSSIVQNTIVFVFIGLFLIFVNLGIAFWLGEILNKTYYGFFAVAAFYMVVAVVIHFIMHKSLKRLIYNYMVKLIFK